MEGGLKVFARFDFADRPALGRVNMAMFVYFIVLRINRDQLSGCPITRIPLQADEKVGKRSTLLFPPLDHS